MGLEYLVYTAANGLEYARGKKEPEPSSSGPGRKEIEIRKNVETDTGGGYPAGFPQGLRPKPKVVGETAV